MILQYVTITFVIPLRTCKTETPGQCCIRGILCTFAYFEDRHVSKPSHAPQQSIGRLRREACSVTLMTKQPQGPNH